MRVHVSARVQDERTEEKDYGWKRKGEPKSNKLEGAEFSESEKW